MAKSDPDHRCSECRYFRETANLYADDLARLGQCRRRAPITLDGMNPGKIITRFPLMREDGDCGEFDPMTEKQKELQA